MTKSNIKTLIGTICMLVVMIGYISYATITPFSSLENVDITSNTGMPIAFTASGGSNLSVTIETSDMFEENAGTVSTTTDTLNVTLDSDGLKKFCCTYDFVWNWDSSVDAYPQNNNELVVSATSTGTYEVDSTKTTFETNASVFTYSIINSGSKTLGSGQICNKNNNVFSTSVNKNYTITLKINNLEGVSQDNLKGKHLKGTISLANTSCRKVS